MSVPVNSDDLAQGFEVVDASTYERDVERTAELLGTISTSGWEIAEITSDRIFTTNHPAICARERKEGRRTAAEWSAAVTAKGKEHFGENAAKAHARCWRRYGEVSERHPGWSFLDHLQLPTVLRQPPWLASRAGLDVCTSSLLARTCSEW